MGLKGTVRFYRSEPDLSTGTTNTVEYPADLPESSSVYEKRGTSEEVTTYDEMEVLDNEIENAYVIVKMCALHLTDFEATSDPDAKHFTIFYRVNIYESREQRNHNVYDVSLEVDIDPTTHKDIDEYDWTGENLLQYCYKDLKTRRGYEDLIDD